MSFQAGGRRPGVRCRDRGRAAGCTLWRDRPQRVARSARACLPLPGFEFPQPTSRHQPEAVDRPLDVLRSTSWTLLTRRSCGCRRSSARVRVGEQCAIRYVAVTSGRVILRPHNAEWPMELVEIGTGRSFAEYIIGRVGHVALRCGGVRTQR